VRHFAPAKAHGDFKPVAVREELLTGFQLHVEIVYPDAGRHSYFLDLDDVLVALGFLIPLCLLEFVLAVVHNLTDGGIPAGRDFYKVKLFFDCDFHRVLGRHNAELFALVADKPYLFIADFLVNLIGHSADVKTPPKNKKRAKANSNPTTDERADTANSNIEPDSRGRSGENGVAVLLSLLGHNTTDFGPCQAKFQTHYNNNIRRPRGNDTLEVILLLSVSILESPGEGFAADITHALRSAGVAVTAGAGADIVVVSPKYRGAANIECGVMLAPDGGAVTASGARSVVTYGMSPRATLTLSSLGETSAMLAVQREIATPRGAVIEEQELKVAAGASADATLAAAGASIMLGLFPRTVKARETRQTP
jgi:hypothetical protein